MEGYKLKDGRGKVNHLLFMDDLKLFDKDEAQIESLIDTVQVVSSDIGMEFGIKKCGLLFLRRGVVAKSEGIGLPNGEIMKSFEDDGYKYLGILEMNDIMSKQMKEKVRLEYVRRVRAVLRSKLNGRNKIRGKYMGYCFAEVWWGNIGMEEGRTKEFGLEDEKVNDNTWNTTPQE